MNNAIDAYRATAAKLAESLATKDREQASLAAVNALVPLDPGGELESNAYRGLSVCSDWATYRVNSRGWRWITEAARLRLLLEASGQGIGTAFVPMARAAAAAPRREPCMRAAVTVISRRSWR